MSQGVANTIADDGSEQRVGIGLVLGSEHLQILAHRNCIPSTSADTTCITSSSGSLFNCASLLGPTHSVSGVKLTTVFPTVDGATGDAAVATLPRRGSFPS